MLPINITLFRDRAMDVIHSLVVRDLASRIQSTVVAIFWWPPLGKVLGTRGQSHACSIIGRQRGRAIRDSFAVPMNKSLHSDFICVEWSDLRCR